MIANYNHSHALSINYYEVVQVFRVEVRLAKAEQVIFVPMALPNFEDQNIIRRFQVPLARAALNPQIMRQLITMDQIELDPEQKTPFTIFRRPLGDLLREAITTRSSLTAGTNFLPASAVTTQPPGPATTPPRTGTDGGVISLASSTDATPSGSETNPTSTDQPHPAVTAAEIASPSRLAISLPPLRQALPVITQTNRVLWDQEHVSRLSSMFNIQVLRPTSNAISLPADAVIEGAVVEGTTNVPVKAVFRTATGAAITDFGPGQNIDALSLRDLTSISVRGSHPDIEYNITVTLTVNRGGIIVPVRLPTVMIPKGTAVDTTIVNVKPGGVSADVIKHLNANRMYYSQVVFRSLDATDLALLLSGYGYNVGGTVVPIAQVINPKPVRYVGNYIAFTTNIQSGGDRDVDPGWTSFLKKFNITVGASTNDVVPLGTGGVFAEAVLGRSNCAEKLDITRFWDWKASARMVYRSLTNNQFRNLQSLFSLRILRLSEQALEVLRKTLRLVSLVIRSSVRQQLQVFQILPARRHCWLLSRTGTCSATKAVWLPPSGSHRPHCRQHNLGQRQRARRLAKTCSPNCRLLQSDRKPLPI